MTLLTRADVERICATLDVAQIIKDALILHSRGGTTLAPEAYLRWRTPAGGWARSLNMPAHLADGFGGVGTKVINANPDNVRRGLPRASGLTMIFNPETAQIECIMEGSYISSLRTALVSYWCLAELRARPSITLGIIGAGLIAEQHIRTLAARLPVAHVTIADLDSCRSKRLAESLSADLPHVDFSPVEDIAELFARSTCVIAATTCTSSYIKWSWLRPGTTLINVSLDDASTEVYVKADKIYVDDWQLISQDRNRLLGTLFREGLVVGPGDKPMATQRAIHGTIGELLMGSVSGRDSDQEIILVNPFGMALEDVAVALHVCQTARALGIGSDFNFDSRTQPLT